MIRKKINWSQNLRKKKREIEKKTGNHSVITIFNALFKVRELDQNWVVY